MPTRTFITDGVRVEIPAQCSCGSIPVDLEAIGDVRKWNELAETCSFCGDPIRLTAGPLEHVHAEPKERDAWTIQNPEWESHVEWFQCRPEYTVDIRAHTSCAVKGTPYLNWSEEPSFEAVYPDVEPPKVSVAPCEECGAVATEEDILAVIAKRYGLDYGSICGYCGEVIRLLEIGIRHRSLSGQHINRWHFSDWRWSDRFDWHIFREGRSPLNARGHLRCAMKTMPFAKWNLAQK